jgi:triphosphoribosyl-dephospho-CoA synthase
MKAARDCFLQACALDVAVRKPGNVSLHSPGHGMRASMFIDAAHAAAGPLFEPGARVGERIEGAVAASWAATGCNTNLGILLLCAPIAAAVQRHADLPLREAVETVLADLDVHDTRAAYRAIARANPGGLGEAAAEDVHQAPTLGLRAAMSLAAGRDSIARQYRDGFADLFVLALPVLPPEFSLSQPAGAPATAAAVQRLYLTLMAAWPDSHIVRKHGEPLAHSVMTAAHGWLQRQAAGIVLDTDPAFAEWDAQLKAQRLNPGTSADLTVATLLLAGLSGHATALAPRWHGT